MASHTSGAAVATSTRAAAADDRPAEAPVQIQTELCKACGICIGVCPKQVLMAGRHGVAEVERAVDCTACRFCELHCPEFAISVRAPVRSGAAHAEGERG